MENLLVLGCFAFVGGVYKEEYIYMEVEFVNLLDFNLFIKNSTYRKYEKALEALL